MPKIKAFTSGWTPCSSHYNYTSQVCIPSNEHSGKVAQLCFKNRPDLQNRLPPHIYCHQHRVLVTLVEDYWDMMMILKTMKADKKNVVSYFQITFYPHNNVFARL